MTEKVTAEQVKLTLDHLTSCYSAETFFTISRIVQGIGRDLRMEINYADERIGYEIQEHLDHYVNSGEVSRVSVRRDSDYYFETQPVYRSTTTK